MDWDWSTSAGATTPAANGTPKIDPTQTRTIGSGHNDKDQTLSAAYDEAFAYDSAFVTFDGDFAINTMPRAVMIGTGRNDLVEV